MFVFMLMIVLFLSVFFWKDLQLGEKEKMFFWGTFLAIPVQALGFYIPIFSRASIGIFLPMIAILVPNILQQNDGLKNQYFPPLFVFCLFFVYYVFTFEKSGLQLNPYVFYRL